MAATQTFGDLLIWHPHIHCLVTDGVFDHNQRGEDIMP
ncbi:MAG: transposase [Acidobacteria bacterium]|nr:transposase [Acidobacteriota bacterium]